MSRVRSATLTLHSRCVVFYYRIKQDVIAVILGPMHAQDNKWSRNKQQYGSCTHEQANFQSPSNCSSSCSVGGNHSGTSYGQLQSPLSNEQCGFLCVANGT